MPIKTVDEFKASVAARTIKEAIDLLKRCREFLRSHDDELYDDVNDFLEDNDE